jgi:hypothetical protein
VDLRLSTLDVADDLVGDAHDLAPAFRRDDELGATVPAFRSALDVAQLFELVDDPADDLLVAPRAARELGGTRALLVEVRDHGAVEPGQLSVPFRVKATGAKHEADWAWVFDVEDGRITQILAIMDLSGVADEVAKALDKAQKR